MSKLEQFWRALESVPGLALITVDWKEELGLDFDAAQRFLRPTDQQASAYPCPSPGGDGCPRRIVLHGPEEIIAVCGDSPRNCDTVELRPADIVIYEVNLRLLCVEITAALDLKGTQQPVPVVDQVWSLGAYVPRVGEQVLVYFALPTPWKEFRQIVMELLAGVEARFLLLTPTSHPDTGTLDLIQRSKSTYLALSEVLAQADDGRLVGWISLADVIRSGGEGDASAPRRGAVFRRQAERWEIIYQGEPIWLNHKNGLAYIRILLQEPGREFLLEDLPAAAGEHPPPAAAQPATRGEPGSNPSSSNGGEETLDAQAVADYRQQLAEISTELAEAEHCSDLAGVGKLRYDKKFIEDELARARGRRGRRRGPRTPLQRERERVSRAIQRALSAIEKHDDLIGTHLRNSLEGGGTWSYRPESPVLWTV